MAFENAWIWVCSQDVLQDHRGTIYHDVALLQCLFVSIRCQHSLPLQSSLGKLLFWISCSRTVTLNWKTLVAEACDFPLCAGARKHRTFYTSISALSKTTPKYHQIVHKSSVLKETAWRKVRFEEEKYAQLFVSTSPQSLLRSFPSTKSQWPPLHVQFRDLRICMLQSPAFQIRPAVQQFGERSTDALSN